LQIVCVSLEEDSVVGAQAVQLIAPGMLWPDPLNRRST